MPRAALIDQSSNTVINIEMIADGETAPSDFVYVASATASKGWTYNGTVLAPPASAPSSLSAAQLIAYAQKKALTIEGGGITVNIGTASATQSVECATDPNTVLKLQIANGVAQANSSVTQAFPFPSGVVTLSAVQIQAIFTAVIGFWQQVTTTLAAVVSAINAGTITTAAQVDLPPSPVPSWPANS